MGNELDQTRLAALNQAAHDLRGMAEAKEVVERANVYLAFLTAGEPEKALEKNRLIARHQWDFVNDCPASETMTLGEPPVGPHPFGLSIPFDWVKSVAEVKTLLAHAAEADDAYPGTIRRVLEELSPVLVNRLLAQGWRG